VRRMLIVLFKVAPDWRWETAASPARYAPGRVVPIAAIGAAYKAAHAWVTCRKPCASSAITVAVGHGKELFPTSVPPFLQSDRSLLQSKVEISAVARSVSRRLEPLRFWHVVCDGSRAGGRAARIRSALP
jgi:hypothetical protein